VQQCNLLKTFRQSKYFSNLDIQKFIRFLFTKTRPRLTAKLNKSSLLPKYAQRKKNNLGYHVGEAMLGKKKN
jgi:hypothetical protein